MLVFGDEATSAPQASHLTSSPLLFVLLGLLFTITSYLASRPPLPQVFTTSVFHSRQAYHHSPQRFLTSRPHAVLLIVPGAMHQSIRFGLASVRRDCSHLFGEVVLHTFCF